MFAYTGVMALVHYVNRKEATSHSGHSVRETTERTTVETTVVQAIKRSDKLSTLVGQITEKELAELQTSSSGKNFDHFFPEFDKIGLLKYGLFSWDEKDQTKKANGWGRVVGDAVNAYNAKYGDTILAVGKGTVRGWIVPQDKLSELSDFYESERTVHEDGKIEYHQKIVRQAKPVKRLKVTPKQK